MTYIPATEKEISMLPKCAKCPQRSTRPDISFIELVNGEKVCKACFEKIARSV
jgi:formylmethanofuran dehydrogenase subunit E